MRRYLRIPLPFRPFWIARPVAVVACAAVFVGPAFGQGEPQYVGWSKVEGARETREIKEKLREGSFDGEARRYLLQTVLPQLGFEENRITIERTRRRMRELILTDVGDDKAFMEASRTVADFMNALAKNEDAEPVVRINAMLLLGELKSREGKPWPPAAAMLAAAAGDATLPMAVRIAALAGINRHVDGVKNDPAALAALAQACGPTVQAIVAEPLAAEGRIEREWLASRAVSLLPFFVPNAPKDLVAMLARLLQDETRSIDTRVRAAAALGATAGVESGVDAPALVESIRGLAIRSLEADASAAAARRFERDYRGASAAPPAGPQPGIGFGIDQAASQDPTSIPEQACRRAAWRLSLLADAILAGDKNGLGRLMGDAAGKAEDLAVTLRDAAGAIDDAPVESSVLDALAMLRPAAGGAAAPKPAKKPKEEEPAAEPSAEPNGSPFDSPF